MALLCGNVGTKSFSTTTTNTGPEGPMEETIGRSGADHLVSNRSRERLKLYGVRALTRTFHGNRRKRITSSLARAVRPMASVLWLIVEKPNPRRQR